MINYLGRRRRSSSTGGGVVGEAVLVHDPIRLGAARGTPLVEDERLLEPDHPLGVGGAPDGSVRPRGLPEPALRRPVRPPAAACLPVPRHEEVPLPFPDLRHPCTHTVHPSRVSVSPVVLDCLMVTSCSRAVLVTYREGPRGRGGRC